MNILILHSWLKEFVKTDATPETIAEKLSLCSLSVEKLHKRGGDTVYEIEVTSNRYDTLSVLGIAREVAAVLPQFDIKADLASIDTPDTITIDTPDTNPLAVTISSPELCPRFTAVVLDNVEIKDSPEIVQERLEMCGIRALNNVVDVSNYLMLELGQPMHISDFDKLGNTSAPTVETGHAPSLQKETILREAKRGEKLITLDWIERALPKGAIVIESGGKLIDLCGIMGGQNSQVDENTKRILLFIQIYDPVRIRQTSQELALRTEASARFEKGIDPAGILPAMSRAIEMLKENARAKVASSLLDIKNQSASNPPLADGGWSPHEVELELPEIARLLGVRIEREEVIQILKSLGFEVTIRNSGLQVPTLVAKVPSWRDKDITIAADLVEEVARLYGYHNLPNLMPEGAIPETPQEKKFWWEDKAKDFLKHQGFYEVYNYSFVSEEDLQTVAARHASPKAIKVRNPLSSELGYLRPSLLPSLLQNLKENKGRTDEIKLFELERVYLPQKGEKLPNENFRLTGAVRVEGIGDRVQDLFYMLKGVVEGLLKELGIKDVTFKPGKPSLAKISHQSTEIGTIKIIKENVAVFDLNFDIVTKLASDKKTFEPIPKYPPIIEDLSIILPPKTYFADVVAEIKKQSQLIRNVELIDHYPEKGSVTLRLTYRHAARTLTDEDVAEFRQKIVSALEKNLSAKIRQKGNA